MKWHIPKWLPLTLALLFFFGVAGFVGWNYYSTDTSPQGIQKADQTRKDLENKGETKEIKPNDEKKPSEDKKQAPKQQEVKKIGDVPVKEIAEKTDTFKLEAEYPDISNAVIKNNILGVVNTQIANFKAEVAKSPVQDASSNKLSIKARGYGTEDIPTYVLRISKSIASERKPAEVLTFTYNKEGKKLSFADFFASNDYPAKVAPIIRQNLKEQLADQKIDPASIDKAVPLSAQAFERFYFDDKRFKVIYPEGAISDKISGAVTAEVSLAKIKDLLKPEYQKNDWWFW